VYLHFYAIIIILDVKGQKDNIIVYCNNFLDNLLFSKICYCGRPSAATHVASRASFCARDAHKRCLPHCIGAFHII